MKVLGKQYLLRLASDIAHLPFVERVRHANFRKLTRFVVVSGTMSVSGGLVFCFSHDISHWMGCHKFFIEFGGATTHALGIVPLVKVSEPFLIALAGIE